MEQRAWHHSESPEGEPSAAARRLGCKCDDCRTAHIAYMRMYHKNRIPAQENANGTTVYHSHKGQPSDTTARRWGCIHPRCLYLAGLYLDTDGIVRSKADDATDPTFGLPEPKEEKATA